VAGGHRRPIPFPHSTHRPTPLLPRARGALNAGLESLEWGHGGDQRMAQLLGLDVDAVARGRAELLSGQVVYERVRRVGGGRPRAEKKRPRS